jgi:hypothetical protein
MAASSALVSVSNMFATLLQKPLLQAAAFGKSFDIEFDSDSFVDVRGRIARAAACVRHSMFVDALLCVRVRPCCVHRCARSFG